MEFEHLTNYSINDFDTVKYSIDDWKNYENDEDISIAIGKVTFLSDKPNSHRHIYSIDIIKKYANSYLGKFIVAEYDKYTNDTTTHTNSQQIVGYIPTNQEVQYEKRQDGYWYASLDVAISKIYAPKVYELFKDNNYRAISVEQLVGFTKETEDYKDGEADKIVAGFEGIGITILGQRFEPSISGANLQLTRMSADEIKNIETEYAKHSNINESIKNIMTKLEHIENKLDKEDKMSKLEKEKMSEINEKETKEEETVVENSEISKEDDNTNNTETKEEKETVEGKEVVEVENSCDENEKMDCIDKNEMAELTNKLADAEAKISTYEQELVELRKFKSDIQMAKKEAIMNDTLSKAKEFLDKEKYDEFVNSGNACSYENINSWKNEVLATISDKALSKMSELATKEDGILDMGMPQEQSKPNGLWD